MNVPHTACTVVLQSFGSNSVTFSSRQHPYMVLVQSKNLTQLETKLWTAMRNRDPHRENV